MVFPKWAESLSVSCVDSASSGMRSRALPPFLIVSAIRCMYISVLPAPDTPCSRAGRPSSKALRMSAMASLCASESVGRVPVMASISLRFCSWRKRLAPILPGVRLKLSPAFSLNVSSFMVDGRKCNITSPRLHM